MSEIIPPKILYYVTIYFEDDTRRTPNYFLWETVTGAFKNANNAVISESYRYKRLSARRLDYRGSFKITPDFYHPVSEDDHIDWSAEFNESMVIGGESAIPKVLVTLLSGKLAGEKTPRLFLDEWYKTSNLEEAKVLMRKSNLPLFVPAKEAHLYQPTTDVKWTSWN